MQFNSVHNVGDKVMIDSPDMIGTVVAIMWDGNMTSYKIGWIHNGLSYHDWFSGFRLGAIDKYDNKR